MPAWIPIDSMRLNYLRMSVKYAFAHSTTDVNTLTVVIVVAYVADHEADSHMQTHFHQKINKTLLAVQQQQHKI